MPGVIVCMLNPISLPVQVSVPPQLAKDRQERRAGNRKAQALAPAGPQRMNVFKPTSSPPMFTRGPPLFPGQIGASVCTKIGGQSGSGCRRRLTTRPWVNQLRRPVGAAEREDDLALSDLGRRSPGTARGGPGLHLQQRQVEIVRDADHVARRSSLGWRTAPLPGARRRRRPAARSGLDARRSRRARS